MSLVAMDQSGRSRYSEDAINPEEINAEGYLAGLNAEYTSWRPRVVAPRPKRPISVQHIGASFLLNNTSNQLYSSNWSLLKEGVIALVTLDSKCYHVIDLGGALDSADIRKRMSTELKLFDQEDLDFALYRTELDSCVDDAKVTDDVLFSLCWEHGDCKGTLKFFAKLYGPSLSGSIDEARPCQASFREIILQMPINRAQDTHTEPSPPRRKFVLPSPPPSPIQLKASADRRECDNTNTAISNMQPLSQQSTVQSIAELLSPPSSPLPRTQELENESYDAVVSHLLKHSQGQPPLLLVARTSALEGELPSPPPSPPLRKRSRTQLKSSHSFTRQTIYQNLVTWLGQMIYTRNACDQILRDDFNGYLIRMATMDRVLCLVHSEECRSQLLKMCSTLGLTGHSDIRIALEKDEMLLLGLVKDILESKVDKEKILSLNDEMARSALELLQFVISKGLLNSEDSYRRARRLFIKLSLKRNLILSSQLISGLEISNNGRPVSGGGYADIFRAVLRGNDVAVKHIRTHIGKDSQKIWRAFSKEALLWQHLKHPNVLPFLGVDSEMFPSSLCMISPWMKNGTIMEFREAVGVCNMNVTERLLEIVNGLCYLHSQGVIHGDLRGGNILVDDDWHALLADFGLTILSDATMSVTTQETNPRGTTRWMAPELLVPEDDDSGGPKKTESSDMYAFGCACLEIYTGRPPFAEITNEIAVMCQLVQGKRPSEDFLRRESQVEVPDYIMQFIMQCWSRSPTQRPRSVEIVQVLMEGDGRMRR